MKLIPLLATPPQLPARSLSSLPLELVATTLVALQLATVADTPLNVTVLVPCVAPKFVPVIDHRAHQSLRSWVQARNCGGS